MRVIEEGGTPEPGWWHGVTLRCLCNRVVELLPEDALTVDLTPMRDGSEMVAIRCAKCGRRIGCDRAHAGCSWVAIDVDIDELLKSVRFSPC